MTSTIRAKEEMEEARAKIEKTQEQEREMAKLREQIKDMEAERKLKEGGDSSSMRKQLQQSGTLYESAPSMITKTEVRMKLRARGKKMGDPEAVSNIMSNLPGLSACTDLRALTDLEPENRKLFQRCGGVERMIDCLAPKGQNAPYATIIARTLPCVLDKAGRELFYTHASKSDSDGQLRYRYLLKLLESTDPDDKENACLAIAAAATDSDDNRKAFFEHGLSAQVFSVLQEQCNLPIPRQRLQRVVVMAMSELANGFEAFKETLRRSNGVPMLLSFLTPSHDEYLIKETLQLLGRMTQNCWSIQQELQKHSAIDKYAHLLFAELHDTQISELAALALVNLCSEVPSCLRTIEALPRYNVIRFELLASMARALSASMLRNDTNSMSLNGSSDFQFYGSAAVGKWEDGNAGGDRKHTSFVDNPQFLLRAPKGTNLTVLLQDTDEPTREQSKVKSRPLFLRLCMTAASSETVRSRTKQLDINASGARPASVDDESGVVMLEPNVQAALDISKTREVALRCHIKSSGSNSDDCWVIVPHVGCSHQHSKYVLAVFADQPVELLGELTPWNKRVITSSWTPLCSAPRGIADGRWRNCPQFQLINVGAQPTTVYAFLSYAERDIARNKRHTMVTDPPGGLGAEERSLLSLYVMKSRVPDRRYVGTLSPHVDEYVAHSVITNSWCVSAKWQLEPGDVYAVLAVMAEGTTHEVPLRLTLYSDPIDAGDVLLKPLSDASEWFINVFEGKTDENGMTIVDLLPQGDGSKQKAAAGSTQATLVLETSAGDAFCSITTEIDGNPYKMLPRYQQSQAVLSVPLTAMERYTMTTRCINAQKQPLVNHQVKLIMYSTRQMQTQAAPEQQIIMFPKADDHYVSKGSSALVVYGGEPEGGEPEDAKRQQLSGDKGNEAIQHDPAVLIKVIEELEEQRDSLEKYVKDDLKKTPPVVLEDLRKEKQELKNQLDQARSEKLAAIATPKASPAPTIMQGGPNVEELQGELEKQKALIERLQEQLKLTEASQPAQQQSSEDKLQDGGGERKELVEEAKKEREEKKEVHAMPNSDYAQARREIDQLNEKLKQMGEENKKLVHIADQTKSSACAVQ